MSPSISCVPTDWLSLVMPMLLCVRWITCIHVWHLAPPHLTGRCCAAARRTFKVSYSYPGGGAITRVALVAPCAATHSINMGQRVIYLQVRTIAQHT